MFLPFDTRPRLGSIEVHERKLGRKLGKNAELRRNGQVNKDSGQG